MTEITEHPKRLPVAMERFVLHWGDLGSRWGVNRSVSQIHATAALLSRGTGPFAVDAERASGFRYSNRAYLIQIRRAGSGTVLIDPVSHGGDPPTALRPVEVLSPQGRCCCWKSMARVA